MKYLTLALLTAINVVGLAFGEENAGGKLAQRFESDDDQQALEEIEESIEKEDVSKDGDNDSGGNTNGPTNPKKK